MLGKTCRRSFIELYKSLDIVEQTIKPICSKPVFGSQFRGHGAAFSQLQRYEMQGEGNSINVR
jgi:hypothetical protein